MDKTVSGVSTFLQLSWVSTVFVVSWLYTIFLSPFRAVGVAAWVITSPIRHALGYTWATAMAIVSYLVDEFEALVLFLGVAIFIGLLGGVISRIFTAGVNAIFDATEPEEAVVEKEKGRERRSSHESPGSIDPDFSFSEDDPIPPYFHSIATGKLRAPPGASLLGQTIHEELEDSSE